MGFQAGAFTDENINKLASVSDNVTAVAGGGQSGAANVSSAITRVSTVASGNDSLTLPKSQSVIGQCFVIINAAAANSMNVFPLSGETINALSANAAFAVAAGKVAEFYALGNGRWYVNLTA